MLGREPALGLPLLLEAPAQRADARAQLGRSPRSFAMPERKLRRLAWRRRDRHPIGADALDPPGPRAELKHVADAALVDELLVELTQPRSPFAQLDRVQALVGNGAARRDRQPQGARPAADDARAAVPHDARAQLGELLGRVAPAQHLQHGVELGAGQLAVRPGAPHQLVHVLDLPLAVGRGAHGDHLLREHVQALLGYARGLDLAVEDGARQRRALEQIAPELRDDAAFGLRVEHVAGAPDPLQSARDRLR